MTAASPERRNVSGRYKAKPEITKKGMLIYAVVDTLTNEWKHVYDCFIWAEKKAKELNDNWSPCTTCVFSDCGKDYHACMDCDERGYKE